MTPPSPLPWKVEDGPKGVLILWTEGKPYLGTLRYSDNPNLGEAEARANAAYLEKAVNNYPALVAALKIALEVPDKKIWFEGKLAGCTIYPEKLQAMIEKAEEALKAAGEL